MIQPPRMTSLAAACVALVVLSSAAYAEVSGGARSSVEEGKTITLIHLNDLHANLVPHDDMVRIASDEGGAVATRVESRGGIARIATLVDRIRRDNPASLLLNVGDTYHGGVEALYTRGNAIVPAVNALGVDVGVPGNWDFAYGAITTRMRYQEEPALPARLLEWLFFPGSVERPNFPNLAANLRQTMPPFSRGDLLLPATLVLETGGVRVGFIGLTSDIVTRMASPFAWGFEFLEGEDAYRELIDEAAAELREQGVDTVVVMSELGLHRDLRLANLIQPGVDVFFSAHTHELTREAMRSASGALVVEAGNDGNLGRMDLVFRDGRLVDHRWSVLDVDASVPEDPEVAALVREARAPFLAEDIDMAYPAPWVEMPLDRPIDHVIGHSEFALHRRGVLHNPFNNLLAEVIRRAAGTPVSMTPGFRFDAIVSPGGGITVEQAYRYLPIAPSLAIGEIRGADLRDILEVELTRVFSPDAFEHSGGWLGGFGGLDVEVDLARPDGERVLSVRLSGASAPLHDDEIVRVASCVRPFDDEGVMCSNPNFRDIERLENPATGRDWTPLEMFVDAFESGRANESRPVSSIRDRGEVPAWPRARFMQPLHSHNDESAPLAHVGH